MRVSSLRDYIHNYRAFICFRLLWLPLADPSGIPPLADCHGRLETPSKRILCRFYCSNPASCGQRVRNPAYLFLKFAYGVTSQLVRVHRHRNVHKVDARESVYVTNAQLA